MIDARHKQRSRGSAAVEFILCLPLLLLLAFPVIDLARVLQANMIITNMAREGANLVSRTLNAEQAIMDALAATAPPLDMAANGMIRITKIMAVRGKGTPRNVVLAQYRWTGGSYAPVKGVWICGAAGTRWDSAGSCTGLPPPASAPTVGVMSGALNDGDVIYLVETFYRLPMFFSGMQLGGIAFNPDLYAMTIF
ncbi:pilus assembly protein [Herbaspirillum sp. HC18]|nr:pilus assembly protein [Herbaspirillum sp. HC18]